jgi:hypothetical protein
MYYHHDWWFGPGLKEQVGQARDRCLKRKFPEADPVSLTVNPEAERFYAELEHRVIIYLRDGFTYELGEAIDGMNKTCLLAQCIPGDEAWQAGVFVVSVPYEEIARVEVFAVHPHEKPLETAKITGFRAKPEN